MAGGNPGPIWVRGPFLLASGLFLLHGANGGTRAVSYTHLDVYKRQVQVLIITLFCAAALYAVLDLVGILPSGW